MGRIAGDTAIVVILLGATLQLQRVGGRAAHRHAARHRLHADQLRLQQLAGRRGQRAEKAYAAAFVLLLVVIALNCRGGRSAAGRSHGRADRPADPADRRRRRADGRASRRDATAQRRRRRGCPARRPAPAPRRERADAARGAGVAYGGKQAVTRRDLPVRQGEVLALIGPSGCGKTTLLRSLNRLVELTPTRDPRRPHHARRRGHRRARGDRAAPAREHGLPAAEPVPDEHLRQRRLRAARAGVAAAAPRRPARAGRATRCGAPASGTRSARTSTTRRCACPAASSSGSASPARSPPSPRCCCSTSPARRSTRARPR